MAEHEMAAVQFHATELQHRRASAQLSSDHKTSGQVEDMAGGIIPVTAMQEKELATIDSDSLDDLEGDEPTEEERHSLRKVSDKLPWRAFLVAIIELCERFTYYGLSGPFQNYIQNPYPYAVDDSGTKVRGALNLGQQGATGLTNFFQFWCYVTPILGAIIADQYLGRYRTILYFSMVYIIGCLILFLTSLPTALEHGAGTAGLIVAMIVIGLGTGGIKSNVSPLIAEQYRQKKPFIKTLKSGERVIVDPAVTVQRIYMIFYLCINVGSLSSIATTEMELNIGFWSAYLLPLCMFIIGFVVLILGKPLYVQRPPVGSVITNAFRAMWIGIRSGARMERAKPSYQSSIGNRFTTKWDDHFIDELKRGMIACKVFLFYPIYWVVYTQMLNNFVSQAGTMALHGIPNDIMQNIDALTIIIFIPILDRGLYPLLRRFGIAFKPITRIFMGFMTGALAMAYAAIVQKIIYSHPPNSVHVAVQTPAYFFIGLSEIFASITGLEYAYTKAPASMKSFVMSMYLLTSAFGSALAAALSPVAVDPKLTWLYTGLAVSCFIAGLLFWVIYSKYNKVEEQLNEMEDTLQIDQVADAGRQRNLSSVDPEHVAAVNVTHETKY